MNRLSRSCNAFTLSEYSKSTGALPGAIGFSAKAYPATHRPPSTGWRRRRNGDLGIRFLELFRRINRELKKINAVQDFPRQPLIYATLERRWIPKNALRFINQNYRH